MTSQIRVAAGLTAALVTALVAGCGSGQAARPQAPLIVAHGVAVREPLADPAGPPMSLAGEW